MSSSTRVLRGDSAIADVREALTELLARVNAPVTARVPWMEIWARHHEYEPLIVVVEDGPRLLAAAPLATARKRGRTMIVGLGHGTSDRASLPAVDADAATALVEGIVDASRSWKRPWRLMVEQLPVGDPVAHGAAAALDCAEVLPGDPCPVLRLEKGPDPEAYESKSMRKQVRQARNRLETDGRELAIERRTELAAVEASLDELEALHRGRDHALGRKSALDDERGRGFWREITLHHAARGEVEVVRMTVDGNLAAYDIAFLDPPRYTVWDHRIDVEFGRYFPGHLLARAQLDGVAAREDMATLDHGRGDEPYKQLMSDDKEEYEELAAWSSPTARVVLEAPHHMRRRMASFADRYQVIRRAWVWVKQRTVARDR